MSELFNAKSLNREQVVAGYENALSTIDSQRLEAHVRCVMNSQDRQAQDQLKKLDGQIARLQADFDAWKAANPEPATEEKTPAE